MTNDTRVSILTGVALTLVATPAYADVELAPLVVIDFSSFAGEGFAPMPGPGQLDSDDWSVTQAEGVVVPFGGTDDPQYGFRRGLSQGNTDTTGIWAFDVDGAGLIGLGVQPSNEVFTPGRFALRLVNNTGAAVTSIQVEYTVWVNNNADRASSFDLEHSADNLTYVPTGAELTSPAVPDRNGFAPSDFVEVVTPAAPIADGSQYYLSWAGDHAAMEGSVSDEFAVEGITIRLLDICGNGLVEKDEACDDENTDDGDGCSAYCLLEEEPTTTGGNETSSGGGADTTSDESESESDTVADTSGGGTDVTATNASGSVTEASATSATTGSDTENGESETGRTSEDDDTGGCACTTSHRGAPLSLLLGLLVARRRRSRR